MKDPSCKEYLIFGFLFSVKFIIFLFSSKNRFKLVNESPGNILISNNGKNMNCKKASKSLKVKSPPKTDKLTKDTTNEK